MSSTSTAISAVMELTGVDGMLMRETIIKTATETYRFPWHAKTNSKCSMWSSTKWHYHTLVKHQPLPSHYLYCTIAKDKVWSDSTGFWLHVECVECDIIAHNPAPGSVANSALVYITSYKLSMDRIFRCGSSFLTNFHDNTSVQYKPHHLLLTLLQSWRRVLNSFCH